jgi:hypothetical protein
MPKRLLPRRPIIAKALTLGADAVAVGRPVWWALTVSGAGGIARLMDHFNRELLTMLHHHVLNEQFYTVLRWLQKTDFGDAYRAIPNGLDAQDLFGNRKDPTANTQFHLLREGSAPMSLQLADFIRYKASRCCSRQVFGDSPRCVSPNEELRRE